MISETLHFESARVAQTLYGNDEKNLRTLESELGVKATARDGWIKLDGAAADVAQAKRLFHTLERNLREGGAGRRGEFTYALTVLKHDGADALDGLFEHRVQTHAKKGSVNPKTVGQQRYLKAIAEHDVTFGIGPAGTGKTYLAMAMATSALKDGKVSRIILTRPAVEAGEALGFLPGDLLQKLDPYLRPLYDALHDMMPAEDIQRAMEKGVIEIAPLAYMRGRTLNQAFIVLDEAQNTTPEQMLMFLTRLGFGSKAVVTGDPTQIDLPVAKRSGLVEAVHTLTKVDGVAVCRFEKRDVVRHPLVQRIVNAYEQHRGKQANPM